MRPQPPERRAAPPAAAPDPGADRREALRLVPVSRETEDHLQLYADRLVRWQGVMNLVGPSTLPHLWTRHIADSAQLRALAPAALRWVDLGSGAGFPGLVIAILLAGLAGARVDLVESNNRKCAFLREVARETGAPAIVHAGRIEDVAPTVPAGVEVVTSRALAPLPQLVAWSRPWLDAGALGLFPTGGSGEDGEQGGLAVDAAWHVATAPSQTHAVARILMVRRSSSWDKSA